MINNRQAGRRRGRGGQRPGNNNQGGGRDSGNRIDNRSRGNAAQLLEKYKNLASDAQRAGDRVNTEYYLQFADHYFRVLSETRSRFEENRRPGDEEGDDEFGYEGEYAAQSNGNGQDRYEERANGRDDRGDRQDRPERQERSDRGERQDRPERQAREDRPQRTDRNVNRGERDGNRDTTPRRDERPRYANDETVEAEARELREDRPQPANDPNGDAQPRRRGRPRRDATVAVAVPEAIDTFDAAVLPPAIGIGIDAAPAAEGEGEDRPRRRRRVRAADEVTPPVA